MILTLIRVDGVGVVHAALRDITDFKHAQAELARRRDQHFGLGLCRPWSTA
jgi:hypothetical protein